MNTLKDLHRAVAIALNDPNVLRMSTFEMIDRAIFQRIMGVPGIEAGCRNRITDKYMELITEYAEDILLFNWERGTVALKFALQRIANSTLYPFLPPIKYQNLPVKYSHLRTYRGEYGEPSKECYAFLYKRIELCLSIKETEQEAQALLLHLISNLNPDGSTENDVYLSNGSFKKDGKELRDWAYNTLCNHCDKQVIYNFFANPMRYYKVPEFWEENWSNLNLKDLIKKLKVTGLFKKRKLKKMLFKKN